MAEHGAKGCPDCGARGETTDTRPSGEYWRRRYQCDCGRRWSTIEVRAEVGSGRDLVPALPDAPVVARVTAVLSELIQEINRS